MILSVPRPRLRIWILAAPVAFLALIVGAVVGGEVSFSDQLALLRSLAEFSALIFALLGIWIAILCPKVLDRILGQGENQAATALPEIRAVNRLLLPLVLATSTVIFFLLLSFASPALRQCPWLIEHRILCRSILYPVIGVLVLLQSWCLLMAIVPADLLKRLIVRREKEAKRRREIASQVQPPDDGSTPPES